MGCDIHGVVERRVGNKWVTVRILGSVTTSGDADGPYAYAFDAALCRNYRRFAALAGVRGNGPSPRGLPSDLSETAAYLADYWSGDGHSHSWLPISDATRIFAETEYWPDSCDENHWSRKYPSTTFFNVDEDEMDEYRLVFWFDN